MTSPSGCAPSATWSDRRRGGAAPICDMTTNRTARWSLLAVFVLGAVVRVIAWQATWPTQLVDDEYAYYFQSVGLGVDGKMQTVRPPITDLVFGMTVRFVGRPIPVVRVAPVIVGSLVVLLVYFVAAEVSGRCAALLAALIAALYPNLIGFSHYILSETYFIFFLLAAAWVTLRQQTRLRWPELALAGVLCGLAALTREVGLFLVLITSLWMAWNQRHRFSHAVLAASLVWVSALAVILPWSAYIYATSGQMALVSQTTWMNLYLGNPPHGKATTFATFRDLGDSLPERSAAARTLALASIRERMPLWPFEKLAKVRKLFRPTSDPVRRLVAKPWQKSFSVGEWSYRFSRPAWFPDPVRRALAVITASSYVLVTLLGCAGLVLARRRAAVLYLGMVCAAMIVPVTIAFSGTRFRMPIEPILIVACAPILAEGKTLWREATLARRIIAVAAVVAMAILIGSEYQAFLSPRMT